MALVKKTQELTVLLNTLTASAQHDDNAIYQALIQLWECVKNVNDAVYDIVAASGGIMEMIAKRNVLWGVSGERGNENVINYAWFIASRLKLQDQDHESVKVRRHAIIRYGWLDLAAKELDFSYRTGKILQSALNAGNYLWTLCDKEDHGAEIAASSCLPIIVPLVVKYKAATGDKDDFKMLRNMFQCIYNSARWDPCREAFKAYPELVHLCEELTRHPSKEISLLAAFTICLVSGRDESGAGQDLLKRSPNIISDTFNILSRVIDAGEGVGVDGVIWDPEELTRILMNLSISDANKPMLMPAVPVLIKAMKGRPENAKMNKEIIVTLMQLSFEPTTMKVLQDSVGSIEVATAGAKKDAEDVAQLKALMGRLKPETKPPPAAKRTSIAKRISGAISGSVTAKQPQIMISYNWGSKETVLKVHESLVQAKYKVWIDVEQMSGNIADKMAEAVEGSDVVLMCISSKYKESANCRQEAEYALECKKPLVILMMEKNYKANGWLGLMVGRKLWVDCTDPDAPDVAGVLREVSSVVGAGGGSGGGAASTTPSIPTTPSATAATTTTAAHGSPAKPSGGGGGGSSDNVQILGNKAAALSPSEVVEWMKSAKLAPSMVQCFKDKNADGRALLGIYRTHKNVTWAISDVINDFGCTNSMEVYAFFYELEVFLAKQNA